MLEIIKLHVKNSSPCSFFFSLSLIFSFFFSFLSPFPPSLPLLPLQFIPPFSITGHSSGAGPGPKPKSELTGHFGSICTALQLLYHFRKSPWSLKKVTLGLVCMFPWSLFLLSSGVGGRGFQRPARGWRFPSRGDARR